LIEGIFLRRQAISALGKGWKNHEKPWFSTVPVKQIH
jgi:hypothetical protein